ERDDVRFFATLGRADAPLTAVWLALLILRSALPALFGIAMGVLVGAVQRQQNLTAPLTFMGVTFVLLQVLTPIHQAVSLNLGDRVAALLYDRLTRACATPSG